MGSSATLPSGSAVLTGWTVTGSCGSNCLAILDDAYFEVQGSRTLEFHAQSGFQSVDLTGSGNTLTGGIQQQVLMIPGALYDISFWVGNMDNTAPFSYSLPSSIELLVDGSSL